MVVIKEQTCGVCSREVKFVQWGPLAKYNTPSTTRTKFYTIYIYLYQRVAKEKKERKNKRKGNSPWKCGGGRGEEFGDTVWAVLVARSFNRNSRQDKPGISARAGGWGGKGGGEFIGQRAEENLFLLLPDIYSSIRGWLKRPCEPIYFPEGGKFL